MQEKLNRIKNIDGFTETIKELLEPLVVDKDNLNHLSRKFSENFGQVIKTTRDMLKCRVTIKEAKTSQMKKFTERLQKISDDYSDDVIDALSEYIDNYFEEGVEYGSFLESSNAYRIKLSSALFEFAMNRAAQKKKKEGFELYEEQWR